MRKPIPLCMAVALVGALSSPVWGETPPPAQAPVPGGAPTGATPEKSAAKSEKLQLSVQGMSDQKSAKQLTDNLRATRGVKTASCNQEMASCDVEIDTSKASREDVISAINKQGYQATQKSS